MSCVNCVDVGVFQQAKHGNSCNGDSYFYVEMDGKFICAIADGLGSGELARESSKLAIDSIREAIEISYDIDYLLQQCNKKLMKKRGVVIGILMIDLYNFSYDLSSIGNVRIITISPDGEQKKHIPTYGYLPDIAKTYRISNGEWVPGQLFMMFSDGIDEKTILSNTIMTHDIKTLMNEYKNVHEKWNRDDSTLIAIKCNNGLPN